jgi:transcriptional regulator with XRE-family HTH domain
MNLGRVIRQLREKRNLTQSELATKVGTTAANLSRIENDRHSPSADLLGSIAYVFGLKVYELIALTEGVQVTATSGFYSADEETLLACFRKMPKEEQVLLSRIADSFSRIRRAR